MDKAQKILVLDDDSAYCEAVCSYLAGQGCTSRAITRPAELEAALQTFKPDLLLLDQKLGETTGTQLLRAIRAKTDLPCIVVSGGSDSIDRVVNLEIGADDEVDKSVSPRELLARIRAVLRRRDPRPVEAASGWRFLIPNRLLLRPDGSECYLTTAEFEALRMLFEARESAVTRAALCEGVFHRPHTPEDRAVDTVIKKLRTKIDQPGKSSCIRSVRPTGYVFTNFPTENG
jgi:DNA-binding response OmpR family regulator